jgi:glutamine synthetase
VVPGFEAPVNLVYSRPNRSACIRIPITGANPKAKRLEFRAPDPSCNLTWIDLKRTHEIAPLQLRPHPHGFELYYDV